MTTCPCCSGKIITRRVDENFNYDTGRGFVNVRVLVPLEHCTVCGNDYSGPAAAGRRSDATLRAVLELLHRLVPEQR